VTPRTAAWRTRIRNASASPGGTRRARPPAAAWVVSSCCSCFRSCGSGEG
jgi:hypothetical protein